MSRSDRRGFTAVEVLIAMTIFVIGAAGVMTMQKASIQGDLDARRMDLANSIARTWIERLQLDASQWTGPSPTNATSNLVNAKVLNHVVAANNTWFFPADYVANVPPLSYSFDILGRDLTAGNGIPPVFCTEVRLTTLVKDPTLGTPELIRADVRVYWPRGITTTLAPTGFCTTLSGASGPDPTVYGAVYATTSIRENPGQ
jgi:prepilin-type N-terminal cleavage/methylation domain-containing protein